MDTANQQLTMTLQPRAAELPPNLEPKNCSLIKDVPFFEGVTIGLYNPFEKEETELKGDILLERVEKEGKQVAGQLHAEQMFVDKKKIPADWQKFRLLFLGSQRKSSANELCVCCFVYHEDEWTMIWERILCGVFGSHYRIVCIVE